MAFIDWDDLPRWQLINEALGLDFADPAETYSTSAHLFAELDIPEGVTGRLPRQARTRAGLDAEQVEDLGETGGRRSRTRTRVRKSGHDAEGAGSSASRTSASDSESGSGRRRRRTRGGHNESHPVADAPSDSPDEGAPTEASTRRRRSRRRTRGGQPVAENAPIVQAAVV